MKADKEFAGHIELLKNLGFVEDFTDFSTGAADGGTNRMALMVRPDGEASDMAIIRVLGDKDDNKISSSVTIENIDFLLRMALEARKYADSRFISHVNAERKGA